MLTENRMSMKDIYRWRNNNGYRTGYRNEGEYLTQEGKP